MKNIFVIFWTDMNVKHLSRYIWMLYYILFYSESTLLSSLIKTENLL